MPCDTISTMEIEVGNLDPTLAAAAITSAGLRGTYLKGSLELRGVSDQNQAKSIFKQAYAGEVIKSQAKKFGWSLRQTSKFEYEVTKR